MIIVLTSINVHVNVHVAEAKSNGYDYVIITTDDLKDSLTDFKNWKEELGYSVNITTVSWIYDNYLGKDEPEKIRNFLIDKYDDWGINFVLIVGSLDSVPIRYCYADPSNHKIYQWIIPTDYYYADLTGNWDTDGDGYYGEGVNFSKVPPDNWDDKVDFNAEVYVGRIPIDNATVVQAICNKTITYEQSSDSWKEKVLLLGAFTDIYQGEIKDIYSVDNGYFMDMLKSSIFEPNNLQVTTLYEKEGLQPSPLTCDEPLNETNVLKYWQEGYGIVCWGGHGDAWGAVRTVWKYDDGDGVPSGSEIERTSFIRIENAKLLDNSKPTIVFSTSCLNAEPDRFTRDDNLGSALMKNGAIIFIGSSRETWVGASKDYLQPVNWTGANAICQYFFTYLIEENQTCGQALYNSKMYCFESNLYNSLQVMYGLNLYGDPSLKIQNENIKNNIKDNESKTPDFEIILVIVAITLVFLLKRKRI